MICLVTDATSTRYSYCERAVLDPVGDREYPLGEAFAAEAGRARRGCIDSFRAWHSLQKAGLILIARSVLRLPLCKPRNDAAATEGSARHIFEGSTAMPRSRPAVSKRGAMPTVACVNKASTPLGVDFGTLISALQVYVDKHLAPVWGTGAKLVETSKPRKDAWTMMFLDTARHAKLVLKGVDRTKVIGQHKLHELPLATVFVEPTLAAKSELRPRDKISVAASHELAEMLVDPGNNLWCEVANGTFYAYEVCDAVEEKNFRVHGLLMSNFVYPAYFDAFRKPKSTWFDHMGAVNRPFQILKDGYMPVKENGKLILKPGSPSKKRRLAEEDRDLHRSEFRGGGGTIRVRVGSAR